jgi:CheY-like chemotaxis protein
VFATSQAGLAGDEPILVIEDDQAVCAMLGLALREELGASVVSAGDGRTGLRLARELLPRVILLDLWLPDHGGLTVRRALACSPRTRAIPVVGMTALHPSLPAARALAARCQEFLAKPFHLDDVLSAVTRCGQRGGARPG